MTYEVRNATTGFMLYFFNADNPTQSTSWVTNGNVISVTIPVTGVYMVMVRAYWTGDRGTADLYYNNALFQSGIIVAGTYYAVNLTKSGALNYFTANPGAASQNTDTYIFLSTFRNSEPIMAYNDDYHGSGDFNWAWLSRKLFNFAGWPNPFNRAYIFGSAYASWADGNCDYYFCNNAGTDLIGPYFPNLKADDAIKSANSTPYGTTPYYNCIAWSGGVTGYWVNPFYTLNDFNLYYRNQYPDYTPRYAGAWNFTRSGATWDNAIVDVWANGGSYPYTGFFQHGSAKKPASSQMHGYDWESKCGQNIRGFHPRTALSGAGYGNPVIQYIWDGTYAQTQKMADIGINRPLTFEESVKLGLTKVDEVSFSTDEQAKLAKYISKIPSDVSNEFSVRFGNWRQTWDKPPICFMSHTRDYAKSDEYKAFLDFCQKQGKTVWPLLFNSYQKGNLFLVNVFEDLLYSGRNNLMDEVKTQNESNRYTSDGTYVIHSMEGDWRNFCKKVLEREFE